MTPMQRAQQLRCAAVAIRFAEEYLSKAQDQLRRMRESGHPSASHVLVMRHRAKAEAAKEIALFLEEQTRQDDDVICSHPKQEN